MDTQLYEQLLSAIQSYDFNDESGFKSLRKHARNYGVTNLTQREFVEHAKNMGVSSHVKRVDTGLVRYLAYEPKADQYRNKVMPVIDICPNCKGSGFITIKLGNKTY